MRPEATNQGDAERHQGGAERHQIVIVGAGPAGSSAAARLGALGHSVLLLEARRFPRDKVCGDVLLPELEPLLNTLGTSLSDLAPDARVLTGCCYTTAAGRRVTGSFRDAEGTIRPWRILPRRLFDQRLAAHAVARGAELREQHRLVEIDWDGCRNRLRIATPGGERWIETPLVIGADGAKSRVARSRGLRPRGAASETDLIVALRTYVPWRNHEPVFEAIIRREFLRGCCWIVPGPGGLANVGVGVIARDRRRRGLNLRSALVKHLGSRVDLEAAPPPAGWQLPLGSKRQPAITEGALLVGDAAGLIDPFTGHGIHHAIESGIAAATAARAALAATSHREQQRALESSYRPFLRGKLARELRLGTWLLRVHSQSFLIERFMGHLARHPVARDRVMGLVGHAIRKRDAFTLTFLRDVFTPR